MEAVVKSELSFNNILIRYGFNFYLDRGGGLAPEGRPPAYTSNQPK